MRTLTHLFLITVFITGLLETGHVLAADPNMYTLEALRRATGAKSAPAVATIRVEEKKAEPVAEAPLDISEKIEPSPVKIEPAAGEPAAIKAAVPESMKMEVALPEKATVAGPEQPKKPAAVKKPAKAKIKPPKPAAPQEAKAQEREQFTKNPNGSITINASPVLNPPHPIPVTAPESASHRELEQAIEATVVPPQQEPPVVQEAIQASIPALEPTPPKKVAAQKTAKVKTAKAKSSKKKEATDYSSQDSKPFWDDVPKQASMYQLNNRSLAAPPSAPKFISPTPAAPPAIMQEASVPAPTPPVAPVPPAVKPVKAKKEAKKEAPVKEEPIKEEKIEEIAQPAPPAPPPSSPQAATKTAQADTGTLGRAKGWISKLKLPPADIRKPDNGEINSK